MRYRDEIKAIAASRGVDHLFHFTPSPNLPSIVEYGLVSRSHLESVGLPAYTSIGQRLDGENLAISLSVSALNHRMFASKRAASGRADWVVLALSSSILWTHECRFYRRNAARREMLSHRGFIGGPWAFSQLFSDTPPQGFVGASYRNETQIPESLTTYSEAEIQVMEPIAPAHIMGAWVGDMALACFVQEHLNFIDGPERDVLVRDFVPAFANGFDEWG